MAKREPTWVPREEDYQRIIHEQMPWLQTGMVPETLAPPVQRPLACHLPLRLKIDEPRRFQIVVGPRRVGKSTCLYQTVKNLLEEGSIAPTRLWWLRLDHPLLMRVPLGTLVRSIVQTTRATPEKPAFLFLDELTYAEDWDLWLKTFYDERLPVRIAGSSSSTAALRRRRLETGVGRWDEQYLAPYLLKEYLDLMGRTVDLNVLPTLARTLRACLNDPPLIAGLAEHRRRFLLTGGFPELLTQIRERPIDDAQALLQSQRTLRTDAVERAVYKDIPQAFEVGDPMLLERLLYTLAGQIAGILSPQNLCRQLGGMTQPTFDKYLSYLERAFLVFTVPNYSGTEVGVQRRGRKLYFVDGAVRNAALQRGLAPLSDDAEMGLLMENLAAGHLHALSQQTGTRLYHWRSHLHEVDLIYDHPEEPLAFEIGSSARHARSGLCKLMGRFPKFKGGCFLVFPSAPVAPPESQADRVGSLPLDLLLLAVGAQAENELQLRLSTRPPAE